MVIEAARAIAGDLYFELYKKTRNERVKMVYSKSIMLLLFSLAGQLLLKALWPHSPF
jgi:Na+(H+)/acetate symporter ActP